jgi:hypothetical protein
MYLCHCYSQNSKEADVFLLHAYLTVMSHSLVLIYMHINLHSRCDVVCSFGPIQGINFFTRWLKSDGCRIIYAMFTLANYRAVLSMELHIMSHKRVNCCQLLAVTVLLPEARIKFIDKSCVIYMWIVKQRCD